MKFFCGQMNRKRFPKKEIILLVVSLAFAGCGGGSGWPQGQRDKLVKGCVEKAKAGAPGLDDVKLKNYCSCYQQELEKKYPSVTSMIGAKSEELAKSAEICLPLMFK